MTADIKTKNTTTETANDAVDSLSRATLTSLGVVSGLIGFWAAACMVGAIVSNGPGAVLHGLVTALF